MLEWISEHEVVCIILHSMYILPHFGICGELIPETSMDTKVPSIRQALRITPLYCWYIQIIYIISSIGCNVNAKSSYYNFYTKYQEKIITCSVDRYRCNFLNNTFYLWLIEYMFVLNAIVFCMSLKCIKSFTYKHLRL